MNEQEILNQLDAEEISALAYGFPLLSNDEYDLFVDEGLSDRTDVNGNWKPLDTGFDGFAFVDDEDFDNFLTKKARERNKRRRRLKAQGRQSGLSRREARKQARKQALKDIPRDKLKTVLGNVGRGILKGALAPHRGSYLLLIRMNFRGFAMKLNSLINLQNGNKKKKLDKLKEKWKNLGGDFSKLKKNVNIGKDKKPFMCGKNCKRKIAKGDNKLPEIKKIDGYEELDFDGYNNLVLGGAEIGLGAILGFAGTIIGALAGVVSNIITNRTDKKRIESEERIVKEQNKSLSEADKRAYEVEMARINAETNPKTAIATNPNLTPQEKSLALESLDAVEGSVFKRDIVKYALFGGVILGGLLLVNKTLNK